MRIAAAIRMRTSGSFALLAMLYASLFSAFGTESPFFPAFLQTKGLTTAEIASVLALGTIVRLSVGPIVGAVADRIGVRLVLGCTVIGASLLGLAYLPVQGFVATLLVGLAHSAAIAALNPLADALALNAIRRERAFVYGWVRGIGSVAFVGGTLASGFVVARYGLASIVLLSSMLFLTMIVALPQLGAPERAPEQASLFTGFVELMANVGYRRALLVAALVIGSQAMNDAFAVIHWRERGLSSSIIGLLWSEAVASEAIMFLIIGPIVLPRFGVARCAILAAVAGVVQWGALATTVSPKLLSLTQPMQGVAFGLIHLVIMRVIVTVVRPTLAATAQALYGTFALGLSSFVFTILSGAIYENFGARGFWAMSALCAAAIPLASRLGDPDKFAKP